MYTKLKKKKVRCFSIGTISEDFEGGRIIFYLGKDRLCGLVVRVSGYRYRGLGFDSRRYQIF